MRPLSTAGQARALLRAETLRRSVQPGRRKAFALVLPIGNLFFCAWYEHHLSSAADGAPLQLLLTIEAALLGVVATAHFMTVVRGIVRSLRVLPVSAGATVIFSAAAIVRDRLSLGLHLSAAFACTIMLHPAPAAAPVVAVLVVLFGIGVQTVAGSVLLVALSRSERAAGTLLVILLALLVVMLWSVAYRGDSLPLALPPVLWASAAIAAVCGDLPGPALLNGLLLAALPPLTLAAARWGMEKA